jgi:hypothetical protein
VLNGYLLLHQITNLHSLFHPDINAWQSVPEISCTLWPVHSSVARIFQGRNLKFLCDEGVCANLLNKLHQCLLAFNMPHKRLRKDLMVQHLPSSHTR